MWVAKFKLRDEDDIYIPLCEKYKIEFYGVPYTNFVKGNKINLLVGGVISGSEENKKLFVQEIKKDKRVKKIEQQHDFILIHAQHPISREAKAEIKIFYNPQYIRIRPIHVSSDGWEYWEVACLDRKELNKLIQSATKYYSGELFSIVEEKLKRITSLEFMPSLTEKQLEAIRIAYRDGYYNYPRKLTIPQLAKSIKKSYSTFQENLRKAENKVLEHFFKYR
jgi:predicted DNA binding protein